MFCRRYSSLTTVVGILSLMSGTTAVAAQSTTDTVAAAKPEDAALPQKEAPVDAPAANPIKPPPPRDFTLRLFGRIHADAAHVSRPVGAATEGLGGAARIRRLRLGVGGTLGDALRFRVETGFARNNVTVTDALLAYDTRLAIVTLGQQRVFEGLEEQTGINDISFIERAAFTDAFGFKRRIGVTAQGGVGDLFVQAGAFTGDIDELDDTRDDPVQMSGRAVYAPSLGGGQLHLGASRNWRDDRADATRFLQRPLTATTDRRFIGTPALNVGDELHYGAEAAWVRGPLHLAGEVHWLRVSLAGGGAVHLAGGYAEAGLFLAGDTRPLSGGIFRPVRVARPVTKGGPGAWKLVVRYDYLDLIDGAIVGGRQHGAMAAISWDLTDDLRLLVNYARLEYRRAPAGTAASPNFGSDVLAMRAQFSF